MELSNITIGTIVVSIGIVMIFVGNYFSEKQASFM